MSAHLFCAVQWKLLRHCGSVFVPKREKFTHVRRHTLCLGQRYNLFRIISHNNSIQHTKYVPFLIFFVPACLVIGLTQPWFIVVIHGVNVENTSWCQQRRKRQKLSVSGVSVWLTPSEEVRFDRPCTRIYRGHRCSHREQNTFQSASLG